MVDYAGSGCWLLAAGSSSAANAPSFFRKKPPSESQSELIGQNSPL
jgi:hypothetical protein